LSGGLAALGGVRCLSVDADAATGATVSAGTASAEAPRASSAGCAAVGRTVNAAPQARQKRSFGPFSLAHIGHLDT